MSKLKTAARTALAMGYWVDVDGVVYGPTGKRRKCGVSSMGFLRFSIHVKRDRTHVFVHHLAALIHFGDEGLSDEVVILHLDRNKANNAQANLALGTRSDAQMLIPRHERILHGINAAARLRRLSPENVERLRKLRAAGCTLSELAMTFGIAKSTASYIVNRKTYA